MFKRKPKDPTAQPAPDGLTPEPSETRLRQVVITLLMILVPTALLFLYYSQMVSRKGLFNPDAMDFAQVGRNLLQGHGWSTYILRPFTMDLAGDPTRQPDVTHGPLYPLFLALAFAPFGPKDQVVVGVSAVFYLLTVPLVYLLGSRVFNRTIGQVAALLVAVNANMLEYATSGLPITLFTLLTTALLLVIYNIAADARNPSPATVNRVPRGQLILAGVLGAALYLTEPMLALVLPVAFAMVVWFSTKNRGAAALFMGLPMVLLVAPWMARNAMLGHNFIYGARGAELWMETSIYPNFQLYRMFSGEYNTSQELFKAIMVKIQQQFGQFITSTPQIPLAWLLAFFLPALLIRYADPAAQVMRRALGVGFLAVVLTNLLFTPYPTLYVAFVPVMLVFALSLIAILIQQAQMPRGSQVATFIMLGVVVVYPLYSTLVIEQKPQPSTARAAASYFGELTTGKPDDIVVSDQPWLVAWYGQHPSLWIPNSDVKFTEATKKLKGRVRWLCLTNGTQSAAFTPSWNIVHTLCVQWNRAAFQYEAMKQQQLRNGGAKPNGGKPFPPMAIGAFPKLLEQNKVNLDFALEGPLKNFQTFRHNALDSAGVDVVLAGDVSQVQIPLLTKAEEGPKRTEPVALASRPAH